MIHIRLSKGAVEIECCSWLFRFPLQRSIPFLLIFREWEYPIHLVHLAFSLLAGCSFFRRLARIQCIVIFLIRCSLLRWTACAKKKGFLWLYRSLTIGQGGCPILLIHLLFGSLLLEFAFIRLLFYLNWGFCDHVFYTHDCIAAQRLILEL